MIRYLTAAAIGGLLTILPTALFVEHQKIQSADEARFYGDDNGPSIRILQGERGILPSGKTTEIYDVNLCGVGEEPNFLPGQKDKYICAPLPPTPLTN